MTASSRECATCGEELITEHELEDGLCLAHASPRCEGCGVVLTSQAEIDEDFCRTCQSEYFGDEIDVGLTLGGTEPEPEPVKYDLEHGGRQRLLPELPATLNQLRGLWDQDDVELSTPVSIRFKNGHEQNAILTILRSTSQGGSPGDTVVSLYFEHMSEVEDAGESILGEVGGVSWSLPRVTQVLRFDPDAAIWDAK